MGAADIITVADVKIAAVAIIIANVIFVVFITEQTTKFYIYIVV